MLMIWKGGDITVTAAAAVRATVGTMDIINMGMVMSISIVLHRRAMKYQLPLPFPQLQELLELQEHSQEECFSFESTVNKESI